MARCRHSKQCIVETSCTTADKEKEKRLQTGDKDHRGEFDVDSKNNCRVEEAERVEREPPTKDAVSEFCLSFAKDLNAVGQQRSTGRARIITDLVSGASFDAGELRLQVKVAEECKRLLEDSRNEKLAAERFANKIVTIGSCFQCQDPFCTRKMFWWPYGDR